MATWIILVCLALLVVLIAAVKVHPFLAFIMVSLIAGAWLGIPMGKLTTSVKTGIGNMLGELVLVVGMGAMLGKLIAESGAAQTISDALVKAFGEKRLQWAMMITGFIVGIPLFYNVGFVLLIPLVFAVIYRTGLPAVYIALPMLAALSVTHGFLPPHPSPVAIAAQMQAPVGQVLLLGILIAIPAILVAGPLFSQTLKNFKTPNLTLFQPHTVATENMPGVFNSFFTALLPALLLIITTLAAYLWQPQGRADDWLSFLGDPVIVLLVSLAFATFSLGLKGGRRMKALMELYAEGIKDISLILLIIAGAGALKQVFSDSGVSEAIGLQLQSLPLPPLVLGWLIAAIIRVCVGSATVAGLTAAGILAPMAATLGYHPALMVLSIGAGSLMLSHVNDSGFWMFKEYFNVSVKETLRTWTVMECIVSVMGLVGVLILNAFI